MTRVDRILVAFPHLLSGACAGALAPAPAPSAAPPSIAAPSVAVAATAPATMPSTPTASGAPTDPVPPVAARRAHVQSLHGIELSDDYFWLREKDTPEVRDYL